MDHWIIEAGRDLRRSLIQTPSQSKITHEVWPGHSALYCSGIQSLWATCLLLGCLSRVKEVIPFTELELPLVGFLCFLLSSHNEPQLYFTSLLSAITSSAQCFFLVVFSLLHYISNPLPYFGFLFLYLFKLIISLEISSPQHTSSIYCQLHSSCT